jgi:Flp pilus assembly protein TadD
MDELIEFFEADDVAIPHINHWELHPVVERAQRRFQSNGIEEQCFSGDAILHIGYRHNGSAILKPINRNAVGIEPGFSGYDGVHLPYETASQNTLYACNFFSQKNDIASVILEWNRVLRDGGHIVITNSLGAAGDPSLDVKISDLLASIEATLPVGLFQIVHCSQSFPDPAAPQVSEVDIVVRKLASHVLPSSNAVQAASTKAATIQGQSPAELLVQALQLHGGGDVDNAAVLAQKVLQSEPRNSVALQLLGLIAYQNGDHAFAIVRFSDALKAGPSSADVYVNMGCAYAALGGNAEAIQCFNMALELQPGFSSAQANLAVLRGAEGMDDALRQNFLQSLIQNPQLADAHSLLNVKAAA